MVKDGSLCFMTAKYKSDKGREKKGPCVHIAKKLIRSRAFQIVSVLKKGPKRFSETHQTLIDAWSDAICVIYAIFKYVTHS